MTEPQTLTTAETIELGTHAKDFQRLVMMRDVAARILTDSGLDAECWRCEILWTRQLSVGQWRRPGRGMALWSITVTRPRDVERMGHAPAQPQCIATAWTPLMVKVLNALEAIMWTDREA